PQFAAVITRLVGGPVGLHLLGAAAEGIVFACILFDLAAQLELELALGVGVAFAVQQAAADALNGDGLRRCASAFENHTAGYVDRGESRGVHFRTDAARSLHPATWAAASRDLSGQQGSGEKSKSKQEAEVSGSLHRALPARLA